MAFNLDDFLRKSYRAKASDIHLNCNKLPAIRINKVINKIAGDVITKEDIKNVVEMTLPEEYGKKFEELQDIDYIYELKDVARFRINYCKDASGGKLSMRIVPFEIKSLGALNLPEHLSEYTNFNNGIVIITGATGSGKSTTLASLIEQINLKQKKHIITIEDPVEFAYEDKKSIITQRSLYIDVKDFKNGIKYALRQDPDVMLVGEIRDKDTLLSAIEAAETGHLVYSTMHTNGTVPALERLRGFLDDDIHDSFTKRVANCIRGIVHQQLVPKVKTGALLPVLEILTFTPTVVDYVLKNRVGEIYPLMQKSRQANLQTMNSSLFDLYQKKLISKDTAYEYSLEKVEMDHMLKGLYRVETAGENLSKRS